MGMESGSDRGNKDAADFEGHKANIRLADDVRSFCAVSIITAAPSVSNSPIDISLPVSADNPTRRSRRIHSLRRLHSSLAAVAATTVVPASASSAAAAGNTASAAAGAYAAPSSFSAFVLYEARDRGCDCASRLGGKVMEGPRNVDVV
ncbi:Protein of unknown function [Gryllus bimaculatus]|nr:Protein of unknown function [Gryllus bimaculatus]